MGKLKNVLVFVSICALYACKTKSDKPISATLNAKEEISVTTNSPKAELILKKTINAHGGDLYNSANYSFVFRGDKYTFKNDNTDYSYSKLYNKDDNTIQDILSNGIFTRKINEDTVVLTEKNIKKATGDINSVIYFATLPHKLNDAAVNATYVGDTTIKGKNYEVLNITFNQDGGGEDFEDQFHYWVNKKTNKIDYLAYNYKVNKGGVRFRSAYNRRIIDGITFQDFINYKAELNTPLAELPKLYADDKLKEVSKIETEHIINLNKNTQ